MPPRKPGAPRAFDVPVPTISEIAAVKAMAAGTANGEQQKIVTEFILHRLCIVDELSYRPDELGGQRETDFSEGKRFVGLQLRGLILQSTETLKRRFGL